MFQSQKALEGKKINTFFDAGQNIPSSTWTLFVYLFYLCIATIIDGSKFSFLYFIFISISNSNTIRQIPTDHGRTRARHTFQHTNAMNGLFRLVSGAALSSVPRTMATGLAARSFARMPAAATRRSSLQTDQSIRRASVFAPYHRWTRRFYSTKNPGKCDKADGMPCQKRDPTLVKVPEYNDRKKCPKVCLPCCASARDPPSCVKALGLLKCVPIPPPYISYVQCMDVPDTDKDCECRYPAPQPCDNKAKDGNAEKGKSPKN